MLNTPSAFLRGQKAHSVGPVKTRFLNAVDKLPWGEPVFSNYGSTTRRIS